MKKQIVYGVFIAVAFLVQWSVVGAFFHGGCFPDAILMLVLAFALVDGFVAFFWWAAAVGIIVDSFANTPMGLHSIVFISLSYIAGFLTRRVMGDVRGAGNPLIFFLVVTATLINRFARGVIMLYDGASFHVFTPLFLDIWNVLFEIIFNLVLFFLFFRLIPKIKIFFAIQ
jgi:rod shape-determining protein MreD